MSAHRPRLKVQLADVEVRIMQAHLFAQFVFIAPCSSKLATVSSRHVSRLVSPVNLKSVLAWAGVEFDFV